MEGLQLLLLFAALGFSICFGMMPSIIRFALKRDIVDRPGGRKKHSKVTPYLGGLAVVLGLLPALLYSGFLDHSKQILFVGAGAVLLFIVSLIDDIKMVKPLIRLSIQVLSALAVVASGIYLSPNIPLVGTIPLVLVQGISVFLIVALINAFNFMDGVDGLAGGLGFITAFFTGVALFISGQTLMAFIAIAFAASLFAFLFYNVNPARVFMGDCGSTIIGFWTAVFVLLILQSSHSSSLNLAALACTAIPLIDLTRVAFLRIFTGRSPFSADRAHLHHILLRLKNEAKQTSTKIWIAQIALLLVAITAGRFMNANAGFFVIIVLALLSYNWIYLNEERKIRKELNTVNSNAEEILKTNRFIGRHTKFETD